ncbi:MAG TPA: primosomal protein N' [Trueperaceae bacterium]
MPLAVDVLFPLPLPPFRFLQPLDLEPGPVGARVAAPWQGGVRIGLVVGLEELSAGQLTDYREIISWLDREPFVAQAAPGLLLELARSSGAPAGVVLASLLPLGLREELVHEVSAVEGAQSPGLVTGEWVAAGILDAAELDLYRRQGMVRERVRQRERTVSRLVAAREPDEGLVGKAQANQLAALERLLDLESAASAADLARDAEVPVSAVRALVKKGYAEYRDLPAPPVALAPPPVAQPALEERGDTLPECPVVLISGGVRRQRLEALLPSLLADIEAGHSVLVLAPEGAFLSATASQLASRLPVLQLSGEASDEQRNRIWEEAASGAPVVLVGTYTALLAPLQRVGRIVVIEAGSGTYKLAAGPRLFIPDAARRLAARREVQLVLTDALPSPEMLVWAQDGEESRVRLPTPRQRLHVSDLNGASGWPVGSELTLVLRQVQERGRQAVLLAPRRGFSAAMSCSDCGHTLMCPNCDLALRYHRSSGRLRCHQCGYHAEVPSHCPNCGGSELAPGRAAGTEWVAGAVSRLLPGMAVLRLDSDRQDDLSGLRAGEPGVLVATTAVFRIPPLPRVSLVGVTLFDTHLSLSDFRAAEESMRLLLQLPELAPEGRPLVVVQTFQPEHEALDALADEEPEAAVEAYLERLVERRKRFSYPPFGQLAKVQVSARDRSAAEREALRLAGSLRSAGATEEEVLGPVPAPVTRVRGQYSFLIYLRSGSEERFGELLQGVSRSSSSVRVRLDVDPRDVSEFLE